MKNNKIVMYQKKPLTSILIVQTLFVILLFAVKATAAIGSNYFVSEHFNFSAQFCGPIEQAEEWAGNHIHIFEFYSMCNSSSDIHAEIVTVASPGLISAVTHEQMNDLLARNLRGMEETSGMELKNRNFFDYHGNQAVSFFMANDKSQGTLACAEGIVFGVRQTNLSYTVEYLITSPECSEHTKKFENFNELFLQSFKLIK